MNKYCNSCGMPLSPETGRENSDFCKFCTDEAGNLYPREVVQKGIAKFLASWAPEKERVDFEARAAHYMDAMPAWA